MVIGIGFPEILHGLRAPWIHVQGRVAALQVPVPSRGHAVSGLAGRFVDEAEGPLLARVGGAQPLR